jgi:subtilisin family serine protease
MHRSLTLLQLAASCLAVVGVALNAQGQVELGQLLKSLDREGVRGLPRALQRSPTGRVPVLAEYATDSGVAELLVGGRYRPMWLTPDQLKAFASDHPTTKLHWAPPRHPLLDRADRWTGASAFRNTTGLTGQGVLVGIVDTGVDVAHADHALEMANRACAT